MPETVQRKGNKLVVLKVDDRVNTTFVCEVKNRLGVGKDQVTVVVRVNRLPMKGATTGSIIGAIIGVIILLALIATAVVMIRKHRNKSKDVDGPPNYKPPPPNKTGGSVEHLAASRENVTEALPLNMYYETNGEPVTNLDGYSDEEPGYNDDSGHEGAPSGLEESALHPRDEVPEEHLYVTPIDVDYPGGEEHPGREEYRGGEEYPGGEEYRGGEDEAEPNPAPSRGDSFMSPAMYV
ncbi:hypothetical protein ANANG_G00005810 [Anguilla anguilla]|uniref:Uncharacterized protein n=1 Tax=Anguilla anguilla TaxID=7936 RepID=A0A9D3SAS2_ANGAN|nr:hypothetical protein ANANG_G00005810 [Anguilla anguilla]